MTATTDVDMQKEYTAEERNSMLEAYAEACGNGDHDKAARILERMPIHPRWAKIIANVMGREFLLDYFNVTVANKAYGKDWLNGEQ